MQRGNGPSVLWLARHGESAGNVALAHAHATGAATIEIEGRDVDVGLSPLGAEQARALGRWFAALPAERRPTVLLMSPFARAVQTGGLVTEALGAAVPVVIDERLREKEFGSLDRLTKAGILAKYPHEAEQRARIGKFYYRPPGGESWCDVVLRLRALVDHLHLFYGGERVLIVAHQVVVLCSRYILEGLGEREILDIDRAGDVANCGLTTYERADGGGLALSAYNFVAPLAPVTTAPDAPGVRA